MQNISRVFLAPLVAIDFFQAVSAASASDAVLKVTFAGEAYKGPPAFQIDFGDKKIGEGTVDNAIDTTTNGRIYGQADWAPYSGTLTFPIPADAFKADGKVSFRLTNDDWGGAGSNLDRNLFLLSTTIDGVTMSSQDFVLFVDDKEKQIPAEQKWVSLNMKGAVAIANPPAGGWPSAKTEAPAPAASTEAATEPKAAKAEEATEAAPEKPATEVEAVTCTVTSSVAITGYGSNQTAVPDNGKALQALVAKLKDQSCAITVTGYSSISGPPAFNKILSGKRSEAVSAYLKKAGVDMSKAKTVSGGETSQFGKLFSANRRVVVDVAPAK